MELRVELTVYPSITTLGVGTVEGESVLILIVLFLILCFNNH